LDRFAVTQFPRKRVSWHQQASCSGREKPGSAPPAQPDTLVIGTNPGCDV
jgi:hypothetical protein